MYPTTGLFQSRFCVFANHFLSQSFIWLSARTTVKEGVESSGSIPLRPAVRIGLCSLHFCEFVRGESSHIETRAMSIPEYTLLDVCRAPMRKEARVLRGIKVHAVSFCAPNEFPNKFFYFGCLVCKVSLKNSKTDRCTCVAQNPENHGSMWRLQLVLRDATDGSFAIRACVWDEQCTLLFGYTAEQFSRFTEVVQLLSISRILGDNPYCNVSIRIDKKHDVHIAELDVLNWSTIRGVPDRGGFFESPASNRARYGRTTSSPRTPRGHLDQDDANEVSQVVQESQAAISFITRMRELALAGSSSGTK